MPVAMTLFGTDRFSAENYVPLLYDRVYSEKYLGCLIGENMMQSGHGRFFGSGYGWCLCIVFAEKEEWAFESRLSFAESVFAGSLCRTCAEWIFLCVQPVAMGIQHADRLYFCEDLSGAVCAEKSGKEKDLLHAGGILRVGAVFPGGPDRAKYHGSAHAFPVRVCLHFLRKYFFYGKYIFTPRCRHLSRQSICSGNCQPVFL